MNLDDLIGNPKYHSALVRSTGLLSGAEREDRIKHILEKNVWLAARCKNTCVLEEESVTDAIILKSAALIESANDPLAIVALLELGEAGVFCYLFNIGDSIAYQLYRDPNQSVSHFFSVLGENIDSDLFWQTYRQIEKCGYSLDIDLYNLALSRIPKDVDSSSILNDMVSAGIEADATTYYHLIAKSSSYEMALEYYAIFKQLVSSEDYDLFAGTIILLFSLSPTRPICEGFYQDYRLLFSGSSPSTKVEASYCSRLLMLADNYTECNGVLINYIETVSSYRQNKTLFKPIFHSFCNCLKRLSPNEDSFIDSFNTFFQVSFLYGSHKGCFVANNNLTDTLNHSIHHAIIRMSDAQLAISLFDVMKRHNVFISPMNVLSALQSTESESDFRLLLGYNDIAATPPQVVVSIIKKLNFNLSHILYKHLCEKGYSLNLILYNVLIKKAPFDYAIGYIMEMQSLGLIPDIQTIQPLVKKHYDKEGFLQIISIASSNHIAPDSHLFYALKSKADQNESTKNLLLSITNDDIERVDVDKNWVSFLSDLQAVLYLGHSNQP